MRLLKNQMVFLKKTVFLWGFSRFDPADIGLRRETRRFSAMNKSSKCQAPPIPQDRQGFMIANLSQRDIFKVKKAADLLAEAKRKRNLLRRPVSEDEVIAALGDAVGLWEFMFPGARHELLQLIVGDIVVYPDRISFVLKVDGLKDLASEMAVSGYFNEAH